jgi:hypothetical protein
MVAQPVGEGAREKCRFSAERKLQGAPIARTSFAALAISEKAGTDMLAVARGIDALRGIDVVVVVEDGCKWTDLSAMSCDGGSCFVGKDGTLREISRCAVIGPSATVVHAELLASIHTTAL